MSIFKIDSSQNNEQNNFIIGPPHQFPLEKPASEYVIDEDFQENLNNIVIKQPTGLSVGDNNILSIKINKDTIFDTETYLFGNNDIGGITYSNGAIPNLNNVENKYAFVDAYFYQNYQINLQEVINNIDYSVENLEPITPISIYDIYSDADLEEIIGPIIELQSDDLDNNISDPEFDADINGLLNAVEPFGEIIDHIQLPCPPNKGKYFFDLFGTIDPLAECQCVSKLPIGPIGLALMQDRLKKQILKRLGKVIREGNKLSDKLAKNLKDAKILKGYEKMDPERFLNDPTYGDAYTKKLQDLLARIPRQKAQLLAMVRLSKMLKWLNRIRQVAAAISFAVDSIGVFSLKTCTAGGAFNSLIIPGLNQDTCECSECNVSTYPLLCSNPVDDRFSYCMESCCGGMTKQVRLNYTCYCDCPDGSEFIECKSECIKSGVFFGTEGICIGTAEKNTRLNNGYEWDEDLCEWATTTTTTTTSTTTTSTTTTSTTTTSTTTTSTTPPPTTTTTSTTTTSTTTTSTTPPPTTTTTSTTTTSTTTTSTTPPPTTTTTTTSTSTTPCPVLFFENQPVEPSVEDGECVYIVFCYRCDEDGNCVTEDAQLSAGQMGTTCSDWSKDEDHPDRRYVLYSSDSCDNQCTTTSTTTSTTTTSTTTTSTTSTTTTSTTTTSTTPPPNSYYCIT